MSMAVWEHFEHQADMGIRGIADTPAGAFEQVAIAMTAVMIDPRSVECLQKMEVCCEASDNEMLLIEWLNALIYEMAVRHMLFSCFEVKIHDGQLSAVVCGEPLTSHHHPAVEIKGATFTELKVVQLDSGQWLAQCVVDV